MIDQNIQFPASGRVEQNADMVQIIAEVISTTRRAWLSRKCEPPEQDSSKVNRNRLAHPVIRFALDPKRIDAWRARVGRQALAQTAKQPARIEGTPIDVHQNRVEQEWMRPFGLPQILSE